MKAGTMIKDMTIKDKPILVVDDDKAMLTALYEALTRSGYDVVQASSGVEALNKLEDDAFGLVVTDVKMPRMSGLELLREIHSRERDLPVVMITAYGTVEDAVRAMKEGAFDYIVKPFSTDDLEAVVSKVSKTSTRCRQSGEQEERANGGAAKIEIIGNSDQINEVVEMALRAAATNSTVLIQGESGTGKELFARFIHHHSDRADKPFIAINCAALPEGVRESELFGHEKGAFTGAVCRKMGKFEQAQGGTLLLDEVSEMRPELQAKLLRVLQERQMDRVGGRTPISVNIRVIATTNRDLKKAVFDGIFREDLYYRLNVIPITIPPLRERGKDISLLVDFFLRKHGGRNGGREYPVSKKAMNKLVSYRWPGNVREMENVVERAMVLREPGELDSGCFTLDGEVKSCSEEGGIKAGVPVKDVEKELILETLKQTDGNRTKAAKMLGISLRTLRNRLREYREAGIREVQPI